MRKILFILFAACSLHAANVTWLGTTSSAKTATNWVGGVLPSAIDTAYFGAVNLGPCTFDSSFSIAGYHVSAGYSGAISFSGQTFTCSGNYLDSGNGGTRNLGNGITMNGASGALVIGSTVGTVTAGSCVMTFNGTSQTLTILKSSNCNRIVVGSNGSVSTNTQNYPMFNSSTYVFDLGANASLTIASGYFIANLTATASFINYGSGATVSNNGDLFFCTNPGVIGTLPGWVQSGNGVVSFGNNSTGGTINLTGNVNVNSGVFDVGSGNAGTFVYNFNSNTISCGVFDYYSYTNETSNFGGSVFNVTSFNNIGGTSVTQHLNFQNSQWNCSGNWGFPTGIQVTHQTDSVAITPTASATITSAGKSFYNFTNAGAIGIITQQADKLTCNNFYDNSGKFKSVGFADSITGDWNRSSTDSINMSTSIISFTKLNAQWEKTGGVYFGGIRAATIRAYNGLKLVLDMAIAQGRMYVGPNKKLQGTPGITDTIVTYTAGDLDNDTITSTGAVTGWSLPVGTAILHSWIGLSKFFVNTVYDTADNGGYNLYGDSNVVFKDAAGYKYKTPSIPTFDSIRPASVSRAGGTTLTGYVHGAYTPDSIYSVAGNYRTITSQTDTTVITWASVAGTRGYKNYSIVNADNQTATLSNGLYLYADATIDSVTSALGNPGRGTTTGGTAVRIRGHGFFGTCSASLGGVPLGSVVVVDTSLITGTTGAHAAGAVTASVTNGDAQTGTLATAYTYFAPIGSFSYALSPQHDTVGKLIIPLTVTIGGATPDSFTVTPALQSGLSMSHSTGTITGTPLTAGTFNYTVWGWAQAHTDSASAAVQIVVTRIYNKTWNSSGSTNANLAANYDNGILPVAGDTIILDSHSAVQWIPTATVAGDHVVIQASYGTIINLGGFTVPKIVNYKPGLAILNNGTVGGLVFGTQGSKMVFQAGKTITVSSLSAGDWNGSAGHLDSLVSNSTGTQATIHIPGHVTLNHMYFRDIHISGDTVTCPWSQNCRSGGGNQ